VSSVNETKSVIHSVMKIQSVLLLKSVVRVLIVTKYGLKNQFSKPYLLGPDGYSV
jgi:hypothetical protein